MESAFSVYKKLNRKRKAPVEKVLQNKKHRKVTKVKSNGVKNEHKHVNINGKTAKRPQIGNVGKYVKLDKNKQQSPKIKKQVRFSENIQLKSVILDSSGESDHSFVDTSLTKTKPKKKLKTELDEEIPMLVPVSDKILDKPKKSVTQIFNPVTQGLALFKWLIDPITPKEFFENYWEKKVLHVKRQDRDYFTDVFSTEKLDSILREFPLHFNRNVDVVIYRNGQKEVLDEAGRAVTSKVWESYSDGYSVRILNPHTYDQNVHSLIASLQEYFGCMVGTNAYLTPPDSQGFAPHFDDIEAFIIQLEGSKYWKLYKPQDEDVLARDSSQNFSPGELGRPFMEIKLNAGDVLYFPRGTIHEGRTDENEHSFHITVSVYQHTAYIDLLEQAVPAALKKAAKENVEFRKGLPLNYLKHVGLVNKSNKSKNRKVIVDKINSLVTSLVNYIDVDSAADQLGRKFMHDAMPPLLSMEEAQCSVKYDGDYMKKGKIYNRVEFGPEIKVRLLRYYALRVVEETETTSRIYFCTENGKSYHGEEEQWLEIENTMIPVLEALQKKYPEFVEAETLPSNNYDTLALLSILWDHGLLVTDDVLPKSDFVDESDDSDDSEENSIEVLEALSDDQESSDVEESEGD